MANKKETAAPNVSVGADTEQPIQKCTDHSISDYDKNINSFSDSTGLAAAAFPSAFPQNY